MKVKQRVLQKSWLVGKHNKNEENKLCTEQLACRQYTCRGIYIPVVVLSILSVLK